jgi:hypothetical protein
MLLFVGASIQVTSTRHLGTSMPSWGRRFHHYRFSVSEGTVYRALKQLGFSHLGARPKLTGRTGYPRREGAKDSWLLGA